MGKVLGHTVEMVEGDGAHAHEPRAVWERLRCEPLVARRQVLVYGGMQRYNDLHLEEVDKRVALWELDERYDRSKLYDNK